MFLQVWVAIHQDSLRVTQSKYRSFVAYVDANDGDTRY